MDIENSQVALIKGRRFQHITTHIQPAIGETLKVGLLNAKMGEGVVTAISKTGITISCSFFESPPQPLPLTLILALPRPKVLRRVIQHATTIGVKNFYVIKTWRVEKSYFATPYLTKEKMEAEMILGLEQARDTVMPKFHIRKLFKPFVQDELSEIIKEKQAIVAHPSGNHLTKMELGVPTVLVIGPEGGFIPYEIALMKKIGFKTASLGARILRVETAIPWILSSLYSGNNIQA